MWAVSNSVSMKNLKRILDASPIGSSDLIIVLEEHCTECFVPICFQTCALYLPRYDGKCERFEGGIFVTETLSHSLTFKRWAKLESRFNTSIRGPKLNFFMSFIYLLCRNLLYRAPKTKMRNKLFGAMNSIIYKLYTFVPTTKYDHIYTLSLKIEPVALSRNLQFEIISETGAIFFRERIQIAPNANYLHLPIGKLYINKGIIRFTTDEGGLSSFNFIDIKLSSKLDSEMDERAILQGHNFAKIIFWDLDNTLWDGILTEGEIKLRNKIVENIRHFDRIGILNVVVSKNDSNFAVEKLEKLNLLQLFIDYQINWEPKSANILKTLTKLNLNARNAAVIDDSAFERNEIKMAIPEIMVYDEQEALTLSSLEFFNPPQSSESKNRRESYRSILQRESEFLKDYPILSATN